MRNILAALVMLIVICPAAVFAQATAVKTWDFEADTAGWLTMDKQGQVNLSTEAAHVHGGNSSLHFSFTPRVGDGEIPGTLFVQSDATGAQSWQFAIDSSSGGPLIALLREQDESTYVYMIYVVENQWQVLDLPFADFRLEESSKDENGKLDPEQVTGIGFIDPGQWFLQSMQTGGFPFFFAAPSRREIWLDDVKLMSEPEKRMAEAEGPNGAEAVMIEDCDAEPGYWMVLGGRNLKVRRDGDQAADGSSLRLDYELPAKTLMAAARQVRLGLLKGARSIAFSVRSGGDCKLVVSVEETGKSRYSTVVDVTAGNWQQLTVPLRDLKLDDDSKDLDPGLQPEKIHSVQFVDGSALFGEKETANTLWLDEVIAVK